jgi:hypothetical protein
VHLPADEVDQGGRAAAIGHVDQAVIILNN